MRRLQCGLKVEWRHPFDWSLARDIELRILRMTSLLKWRVPLGGVPVNRKDLRRWRCLSLEGPETVAYAWVLSGLTPLPLAKGVGAGHMESVALVVR